VTFICGPVYSHIQQSCGEYGKSLCTYESCWKWCPRASIQVWTRLILFAKTFCRSAFGKSLCTCKRCWNWCLRASIQVWTRLILFAKTFCRSAFGKSLCTYKIVGSDVHERLYSLKPSNFIQYVYELHCDEVQQVFCGTVQTKNISKPFNAGIKSLRATVPAQSFYRRL
jgi:hypothetical protein